jgi:hypothetical protein
MGRDYSRRKPFLPSIRCQTSFRLPGDGQGRRSRPARALTVPGNGILAIIGSTETQEARGERSVLGRTPHQAVTR